MPLFSVNDQLGAIRTGFLVTFVNFALQPEHHRAGGVHDGDVVPKGGLIGGGGLAVGPQQHFPALQAAELIVFDGLKAHRPQPFHFQAVMHDIAQTIQGIGIA